MDMNTILQVFIVISGVIGQLLISHQRREAFVVWLFSNAALIYVSVNKQLWGMVLLYVFFSLMCFYSLYRWGRIAKSTP